MGYLLRVPRDTHYERHSIRKGDYRIPEDMPERVAIALCKENRAKALFTEKHSPETKIVAPPENQSTMDGDGSRRGKRTLTLRKRRKTDEESTLPGSE